MTLTVEEMLVINACLNGVTNVNTIPEKIRPHFSGIKEEIKKQLFSYKITAHEV